MNLAWTEPDKGRWQAYCGRLRVEIERGVYNAGIVYDLAITDTEHGYQIIFGSVDTLDQAKRACERELLGWLRDVVGQLVEANEGFA